MKRRGVILRRSRRISALRSFTEPTLSSLAPLRMTAILLGGLGLVLLAKPSSITSAEGLAQGTPAMIVNGGFEQTLGPDQELAGWVAEGAVRNIAPGAKGERALMLVGTARNSNAAVKQILAIPQPPPPVVTVSALVKGLDVDRVSDDDEGTAEIRVAFLDESGKYVSGPRKLDEWFGTFEWSPWTRIVRIPQGAVSLELTLGLNGAVGKALFDEVEVLWGFPEDQDRENFVADGGFEFVSPLSEWKVGGHHRIVFPGRGSRAALQMSHKKSTRSESSQEIFFGEIPQAGDALLSFNLKLEGVVSKKKKGGVRIKMDWVDETGRSMKRASTLGPWTGTLDWAPHRHMISRPAGASRAILSWGMEKTEGTATVDDMRLEIQGEEENLERPVESQTDTSGWQPFAAVEGRLAEAFDASSFLDPPAGRHGFLRAEGERFIFEDGTPVRFFGVNIQGERAFPTHEEAERLADRLAQYGCNLVRFHHLDSPWAKPNIFDPEREDTQHLARESLDRLDYFIAQLKARGIYVYLDLLVSRLFKSGDDVPAFRRLGNGAKIVAQYDAQLIKLQKKYAHDLLTHTNPYTKTRYVEEPALALVDLINESSIFLLPEKRSSLPKIYLEELEKRWAKYRRKHPQASQEEFYADLQAHYFQDLSQYLRGLGLKIPIAGSNLALEGQDLETNATLDFIDRHAYWDHPKGGFGDLVKFTNVSLLEGVQRHGLIPKLSRQQVGGKPFVVSEWNVPWPNEFRAVAPMVMAAYALFQGWDGLILFNYEGELMPGRIEGNFDVSTKPELFLQLPLAARLFHREDVEPARNVYTFPMDVESEVPPTLALQHGIRRGAGENGEGIPRRSKNSWTSDTDQLIWNRTPGIVFIKTPRTEAAIGRLGPDPIPLFPFRLQVQAPVACVILTSLDGEPLEESKHLLLMTVARSENANTRYNPNRTVLRERGESPILMEPVTGTATLRPGGQRRVRVFALDGGGRRLREIPMVRRKDSQEISLGEAHAYEILFGERN